LWAENSSLALGARVGDNSTSLAASGASKTIPKTPLTPDDTGLEREILHKLLAKTLFVHGTMTVSAIAREMRLPGAVVSVLLKELQKLMIVEAKGLASQDMRSELRFALGSGRGHEFALEAMAQSQYVGAAPVSLDSFVNQVRSQAIANDRMSRADLEQALSHLVLQENFIDVLGPAANSARSILLYGDPGNGKTSVAQAIGKAFPGTIYVPHAFTVGNQIISFFDPTIHTPVDADPNDSARPEYDPRWRLCRRPSVTTGGELTLDMLDLSFNPISRYYEAPVHLKATGGVFIVDDFGRQRTDPQSVLNRWIVPLDRHFDNLTLNTGKKFEVPFDQLVIFSTNLTPQELVDAGALRRLYYKIRVPSPTPADYRTIFQNVAAASGVPFDAHLFETFFAKHYLDGKAAPAGHHPRYILDFVRSVCAFRGQPHRLDPQLLEDAWRNLNPH
jgi:predicted ATPase with chaperone activity